MLPQDQPLQGRVIPCSQVFQDLAAGLTALRIHIDGIRGRLQIKAVGMYSAFRAHLILPVIPNQR